MTRTPAAQFLIDARKRTEPTAQELKARSRFNRTKEGISAAELAVRANLNASSLTKLESGARPLTRHFAEKLAPALNIPIETFPVAPEPVRRPDGEAVSLVTLDLRLQSLEEAVREVVSLVRESLALLLSTQTPPGIQTPVVEAAQSRRKAK